MVFPCYMPHILNRSKALASDDNTNDHTKGVIFCFISYSVLPSSTNLVSCYIRPHAALPSSLSRLFDSVVPATRTFRIHQPCLLELSCACYKNSKTTSILPSRPSCACYQSSKNTSALSFRLSCACNQNFKSRTLPFSFTSILNDPQDGKCLFRRI